MGFGTKEKARCLKKIFNTTPLPGDIVRFKYGKVTWVVIYMGKYPTPGKTYIKLRRMVKRQYSYSGSMFRWRTVYSGTSDWENMEVVGRVGPTQ